MTCPSRAHSHTERPARPAPPVRIRMPSVAHTLPSLRARRAACSNRDACQRDNAQAPDRPRQARSHVQIWHQTARPKVPHGGGRLAIQSVRVRAATLPCRLGPSPTWRVVRHPEGRTIRRRAGAFVESADRPSRCREPKLRGPARRPIVFRVQDVLRRHASVRLRHPSADLESLDRSAIPCRPHPRRTRRSEPRLVHCPRTAARPEPTGRRRVAVFDDLS